MYAFLKQAVQGLEMKKVGAGAYLAKWI